MLFPKAVIPGSDRKTPYLTRWTLIETRWFRVFVHKITQSDGERDMHDHPYPFISFILKGGYREHFKTLVGNIVRDFRGLRRVVTHSAEDAHRLELFPDGQGGLTPAWTFIIVGRKCREWGFHTPEGWVHHETYLDRKFGEGQWTKIDNV